MSKVKKTIVFPPNTINCSYDFRIYRGIPSGIKFTLEEMGEDYRLIGPGYGVSNDYGNGAIYVSGKTMRVVLEYLGEMKA